MHVLKNAPQDTEHRWRGLVMCDRTEVNAARSLKGELTTWRQIPAQSIGTTQRGKLVDSFRSLLRWRGADRDLRKRKVVFTWLMTRKNKKDHLSSNLPFGLVGTATPLLTASLPLSLTESPRPESRDEFFRSRLLAFALILASLIVDAEIQFPFISFFISSVPAFSSSPEKRESLKLSGS